MPHNTLAKNPIVRSFRFSLHEFQLLDAIAKKRGFQTHGEAFRTILRETAKKDGVLNELKLA